MTKQVINVGTTANDKKGDSLRAAFQKVNANFNELYTALGLDVNGLNLGNFKFTDNTIQLINPLTDGSTLNVVNIDQPVNVGSDLTVGGDILPNVNLGGSLGSPTKQWKSLYVSTSTIYINNVPLSIDESNNLVINGSPVSAVANTGNIGFIDDRIYDINGVTVSNDDLVHGATARLSLPAYGSTDAISLLNYYGGVSVTTGNDPGSAISWTFSTDGTLTLPPGGTIKTNTNGLTLTGGEGSTFFIPQAGSGQSVELYAGGDNAWQFNTDGSLRTPNNTIYTDQNSGTALVPNTATLVFTSANAPWVGGVKLLLIAQGSLDGQSSSDNGAQWHTQMAEALVANRPWGNPSDPVMSVYGVTYTSTNPFVSYTVNKNATTSAIEVYATTTESTYTIRVRVNATHINAF